MNHLHQINTIMWYDFLSGIIAGLKIVIPQKKNNAFGINTCDEQMQGCKNTFNNISTH